LSYTSKIISAFLNGRSVSTCAFHLSRFKVDEQRQELERLERCIFPTSRTLMHQDSTSSTDGAPSAMDDSTARVTIYLEKSFETLKAVTGKRVHLKTQTSSAVLL
jgi:hypothetical protein